METATITVTNPTSTSVWSDSNTYTITWTFEGTIANVIIELWKGTQKIQDITIDYTANDGNFDFYVSPSSAYEGSEYRIKIGDFDDSMVYGYSDYFAINVGDEEQVPGYPIWIILGVFGFVVLLITRKIRIQN